MEKKAFRIGKLNIVDFVAILLVILVVAYGAWRLLGDDEAPPEKIDITFTVRVQNVASELYENCQDHLPSTLMASGAHLPGQIVAVEKTPYLVLGPDGQWYEDPDHINLYFTCTATVNRENVMTTKIGEQEVRVGKTDYIMKSEFIEFQSCTVLDVDWGF
ncbi:MAG: DUF4330 domain-containing protein [Oscillibacter sp.]|jgi:hypothetical protein|nr:DUF4330 domain-containing protein [Oscillibacter sp.]MCI9481982.1 DUF4330 domain-containing protein [Oscillibacter sp.]